MDKTQPDLAGKRILLVGGSRASIQIKPEGQLMWGGDNPGSISIGYGGQLFEMALLLSASGAEVSFISVSGDDFPGKAAKGILASAGVDVSGFHLVPGHDTAAVGNIMNLLDQPEISFGNETVNQCMTKDMMVESLPENHDFDLIVTETCFSLESLMALTDTAGNSQVFLCPAGVSDPGIGSAMLQKSDGVLVNREAAQAMYGNDVLSEEQLYEAGLWLLGRGPSQVFISLGAGGVFYCQGEEKGIAGPGVCNAAQIVQGILIGRDARQTAGDALIKEE